MKNTMMVQALSLFCLAGSVAQADSLAPAKCGPSFGDSKLRRELLVYNPKSITSAPFQLCLYLPSAKVQIDPAVCTGKMLGTVVDPGTTGSPFSCQLKNTVYADGSTTATAITQINYVPLTASTKGPQLFESMVESTKMLGNFREYYQTPPNAPSALKNGVPPTSLAILELGSFSFMPMILGSAPSYRSPPPPRTQDPSTLSPTPQPYCQYYPSPIASNGAWLSSDSAGTLKYITCVDSTTKGTFQSYSDAAAQNLHYNFKQ